MVTIDNEHFDTLLKLVSYVFVIQEAVWFAQALRMVNICRKLGRPDLYNYFR